MVWVMVFVGIAVAGLVMLVLFAIWLWRKATALLGEVGVLLDRADELAALLDRIELPGEHLRAPSRSGVTDDDQPPTHRTAGRRDGRDSPTVDVG